ncbi:MAG TPA: quinoprotein dehydrogenase-associated putative ABC transporter substrate-binding protein [Gemmatimonadales bacterium]|nr:quinoprotein dehydrogenase-associated putative ABC transporter substrate-binding protein [Gemmatimonadales bacterium]
MTAFSHFHRFLTFPAVAVALVASPVAAQRPSPMVPGVLRVCADPDNLPGSNTAGEGYENKLAELLAQTWNSKLEYIWWAAPRGEIRMLNGMYCDVMLEAPAGYDLAGVTRPYFRTGYVVVQRADASHKVTSLDDPALKKMRIGVHLYAADNENSPPAMALSAHGVVGNLVGFSTVYTDVRNHPDDIIKAVISDSVDLAIVWGPVAGYYVKQLGANLTLTPLPDDTLTGIPFVYSMGFATRRREHEFRDSLQKFLDTKAPEIHALLERYGIPLFSIPADTGQAPQSAGPAR